MAFSFDKSFLLYLMATAHDRLSLAVSVSNIYRKFLDSKDYNSVHLEASIFLDLSLTTYEQP